MAKYAFGGMFGKVLKDPHFWAPAAAMGVGAVGAQAAGGVKKLIDARNKAKSFKAMLEMHPQLKTRDPKLVGHIFNSLHNVNPMMARDPMVSGAWADTIIESAGDLGPTMASRALLEGVKDLAQIRSQISQATQRESNFPREIGQGLARVVDKGFDRAKELDKEHGDLGVAHKQIKEIQERGVREKEQRVQRDMAKAFNDAAVRISKTPGVGPEHVQQIVAGITAKHSSDSTPGKRLLAAVHAR